MGAASVSYHLDVDKLPRRLTPAGRDMDRDIMLRHMITGMHRSMEIVADVWATLAKPSFDTGDYERGIRTSVWIVGTSVYGSTYNVSDHADEVERGTGIYRVGPGSKGRIWPHPPKKRLVFQPKGSGRTVFARNVRGQRPKFYGRQARIASRLRVRIAQRDAAHAAATEMKARLHG